MYTAKPPHSNEDGTNHQFCDDERKLIKYSSIELSKPGFLSSFLLVASTHTHSYSTHIPPSNAMSHHSNHVSVTAAWGVARQSPRPEEDALPSLCSLSKWCSTFHCADMTTCCGRERGVVLMVVIERRMLSLWPSGWGLIELSIDVGKGKGCGLMHARTTGERKASIYR